MPKFFYISLGSPHNFRKVNATTEIDEDGQFDTMKCTACGIEGKCRRFDEVEIFMKRTGNKKLEKKIFNCTISDDLINNFKAKLQYNSGKKTAHKCPQCGKPLRETDQYQEDKTDKHFARMICLCGYDDLMDVTAREKKRIEADKPKLQAMKEKYDQKYRKQ